MSSLLLAGLFRREHIRRQPPTDDCLQQVRSHIGAYEEFTVRVGVRARVQVQVTGSKITVIVRAPAFTQIPNTNTNPNLERKPNVDRKPRPQL